MSSTTNAALYGKGVFTTVAFRESELFLWEKHWRRLTLNAEKLAIDISNFDEPAMRDLVKEAITRFGSAAGRIRISFLDNSTSWLWGDGLTSGASLSLIAGPLRKLPIRLKLTVSPHPVNSASPLAGIKSCNYLEPILALDEARKRGFDDAIRLNERGEIASACMANVFWTKGARLYTPSPGTGCLPGTTREYILENLDCEEVYAGIEALQEADQIFLTSSGLGVVSAAGFEAKELKNTGHSITKVLPF